MTIFSDKFVTNQISKSGFFLFLKLILIFSLLTCSCPFGLGGLNCGNREYAKILSFKGAEWRVWGNRGLTWSLCTSSSAEGYGESRGPSRASRSGRGNECIPKQLPLWSVNTKN